LTDLANVAGDDEMEHPMPAQKGPSVASGEKLKKPMITGTGHDGKPLPPMTGTLADMGLGQSPSAAPVDPEKALAESQRLASKFLP
jgi:hypothetical protein